MHRLYDERDCVYKGASINETIDYYFESHEQVPGARNQLNAALSQAKKSGENVISAKTGVTAAWDNRNQEYLIVAKNEYSPANVAAVLFDCLVEDPGAVDLEESLKDVDKLIDRYIGRIEKMEELDFTAEKESLKALMRTLRESLHLVDETELNEAELERLSDQIDQEFYAPAAELLEKILERVAIPLKLANAEN
jgi:hypothetical protein